MRFWGLFMVIVGLGMVGARYLPDTSERFGVSPRTSQAIRRLAQEDPRTGAADPASLSYAMKAVIEVERQQEQGRSSADEAKPFDASEAERALDQVALSSSELRLGEALGSTRAGALIRRTVVGRLHSESVPGAEQLLSDYLKELSAAPDEAVSTIQSALQKLPREEGADERVVLIQLAGRLGTPTSETLLMGELTRSVAPSDPGAGQEVEAAGSVESIIPLSAHAALMQAAEDPQTALTITLDGIEAQPNSVVRQRMKEQFVQRFPASEAELVSGLAARGLE